ncbi:MAG: YARHG domain-containing protein [Clostridia bacterium]|nr:YARHG domain-containing protein [Clostridia bacterium]
MRNGKNHLTRIAAAALSLMLLVLSLPVGAAVADSLYIIPDSNTRKLTRAEVWEYQYDTLLYAFNEIYARHGYKFETGSRCYNWFTQMPWYTPNASESSTNHHETYSQCSEIENYNRDLIVSVRKEMKRLGTTNPKGKGMPTPPAANVNKPRGFEFVSLKANQKLPVYSAPSSNAYRANNGKALVNTSGAVYALGYDSGWMLMLYEANYAGQYRVGYIDTGRIKGTLPSLQQLSWERTSAQVLTTVNLTDDPALTGRALTSLPTGTWVTYLSTMFNNTGWDYVETTVNGKTARGFIPSGYLSGTSDQLDETGLDEVNAEETEGEYVYNPDDDGEANG